MWKISKKKKQKPKTNNQKPPHNRKRTTNIKEKSSLLFFFPLVLSFFFLFLIVASNLQGGDGVSWGFRTGCFPSVVPKKAHSGKSPKDAQSRGRLWRWAAEGPAGGNQLEEGQAGGFVSAPQAPSGAGQSRGVPPLDNSFGKLPQDPREKAPSACPATKRKRV